jgi:RHS repeat-associated protein
MKLGSGTTEAYDYVNVRMQLAEQTASNGSNTLMDLTYNYLSTPGTSGFGSMQGNSGQLMAISGTIKGLARDETFTYDNAGRLVTASGWGAWGRQYNYDRWGNRTKTLDTLNGNAVLQNFTLNQQPGSFPSAPNNQLMADTQNSITYGYDLRGNLTSDGFHSYAYDVEGRLAKVDAGMPNEFDYSYDFNIWRVTKVPGSANTTGATTYYVWNAGQVIAEYSNAAPTAPASPMYYHPDRLSTRLITDGSGNVVGAEDVMPFGEDPGSPLGTGGTGLSDKHHFTNYERDPETAQGSSGSATQTGLDYAVNRHYANRLGKFMQPDPMGGFIGNPQSLNRYTYSLADPISLFDPTGLDVDPQDNPDDPYGLDPGGDFYYGGEGGAYFGLDESVTVTAGGDDYSGLGIQIISNGFPGQGADGSSYSNFGMQFIFNGFGIGGPTPDPFAGLRYSVNFKVPGSQKAKQGELRECGQFGVTITINGLPSGNPNQVEVRPNSVQPTAYPVGGFRYLGGGRTIVHGGTLMYSGTFQVGNIMATSTGDGTGNAGLQFGLQGSVPGTGQVISLNIQNTGDNNPIKQPGHTGPYLMVRDTIPGASTSPFAPCGAPPAPVSK